MKQTKTLGSGFPLNALTQDANTMDAAWKLYDALEDCGNYIASLTKQRDELLAALEDLYSEFERTREWGCLPMSLVKARATISIVKGKP